MKRKDSSRKQRKRIQEEECRRVGQKERERERRKMEKNGKMNQ